jgi:hypothetical protein
MRYTLRIEKRGLGYEIMEPPPIRMAQNLGDLERFLRQYHVTPDEFATLKESLEHTGIVSIERNAGKFILG